MLTASDCILSGASFFLPLVEELASIWNFYMQLPELPAPAPQASKGKPETTNRKPVCAADNEWHHQIKVWIVFLLFLTNFYPTSG